MYYLVVALHKGRINIAKHLHAPAAIPGAQCNSMLLADAYIQRPVGHWSIINLSEEPVGIAGVIRIFYRSFLPVLIV